MALAKGQVLFHKALSTGPAESAAGGIQFVIIECVKSSDNWVAINAKAARILSKRLEINVILFSFLINFFFGFEHQLVEDSVDIEFCGIDYDGILGGFERCDLAVAVLIVSRPDLFD